MHFTAMDTIGKSLLSPQGHQYAPTVIDMLMTYTLCIPLYTSKADELVHAYLVHIYSMFGRSQDFSRKWN